jgi:hypothetical protein
MTKSFKLFAFMFLFFVTIRLNIFCSSFVNAKSGDDSGTSLDNKVSQWILHAPYFWNVGT